MPSGHERALLDSVGAIYQASIEPETWPAAVDAIRRAVNGDSAFMLSIDVMPGQGGLLATSNVDRSLFEPLLEQVLRENPFIDAWEAKGAPSGRIFRAHELVTADRVDQWKMYAQWAQPLRFHWTMATIVHEQQPFITPKNNLNVLRARESPTFTDAEQETMGLLMPHLQRSLLLHWRLRFHERKHRAVQEILDRLAFAVILLDREGRVMLANRVAETLARGKTPLRIRQNRLESAVPAEYGALRALIAEVANTGAGTGVHPGGTVHLHDENGGVLLVLATPLCADRVDSRWLGPGICAALFISEPGAKYPLSVELLEQWFGFTPAEAQVAVDLMNGFDAKEISGRREVSEQTVRSQTKSVYEKAGVSRRAQLVKLLLTSPAAFIREKAGTI